MATRHPYMGVIFKLGTLCSTMVTHVNITVLIQAFGTMAILCPLMVPIAYKLTGDETTIVHTSLMAAILSSSTLGHCEQLLLLLTIW